MNQKLTAALAGLALVTLSCFADGEPDLSKLPPPSDRTGLTFTNDIEPIFKASCVRCHSGQRARANLRLDTLDGALTGGFRNGQKTVVITPGNSQTSPLVIAIARLDLKTAMPPVRRPRPGGPGGPGGLGGPGGPGPGGPGAPDGGTNAPPPNPPPSTGGPGMPPPPGGRGGPPAIPLTPEQVGLVRAWIDQGAK